MFEPLGTLGLHGGGGMEFGGGGGWLAGHFLQSEKKSQLADFLLTTAGELQIIIYNFVPCYDTSVYCFISC